MAAPAPGELPPLKWVGVLHEGIPCKRANQQACITFYRQVLGLQLLPRPARLVEAMGYCPSGAWLGDASGRAQFHLIAKDDEWSPGSGSPMAPAGRHTAWIVEDLDALRTRLRTLGVPMKELTGVAAGVQVFVQDPAGHTWEFQQC
jgi:catechol 2,3-dioxygenase-like lactoylglutathione lyase family enzyme